MEMNQSPNLKQVATMQPSLFKRAQEMASGKTESQMEEIARNICATKGINYDDALKQFNAMWGR